LAAYCWVYDSSFAGYLLRKSESGNGLYDYWEYLGGVVMQRVERWTCDQQVVGSNPTRGKAACNNLRQVVHTYLPVTKQYDLVPVKGQ